VSVCRAKPRLTGEILDHERTFDYNHDNPGALRARRSELLLALLPSHRDGAPLFERHGAL